MPFAKPMNQADLKAAIELTKDKFGGLARLVTVRFADIRAGYAKPRENKITLPNWIFNRGNTFALYYALHEVAHLIHRWQSNSERHKMHGIEFKAIEKQVMDTWDLQIEYAKAYPKRVYLNGVKDYEKKK